MPVTLNAAGTQASTNLATSVTYTGLTIAAGSNLVLAVSIVWLSTPGAITVANWDNAGTPQALGAAIQTATGVNGHVASVFGLVAPTTGNKTLQITWTSTTEYAVNCVAFNGADQTGGATTFSNSNTATGNNNSPSLGLTLPTDGAVVGALGCGTSAVLNSVSATQLILVHGLGAVEMGGSYSTSSGTMTGALSATDQWAMAGTGIKAFVAAAIPSPNPNMGRYIPFQQRF